MEHLRQKQLSIVMPVYNRAGIVGRTLHSIAAQHRIGDTKIILVDNNSTDETADVLSQWSKSAEAAHLDVSILTELKPGAASARNRGLAETDTPWVMFFDSDDAMLPGLIAAILDEIEGPMYSDVIGWDIDIELASGKHRTGLYNTANPIVGHLRHSYLSTQRYAARTDLIIKSGGWDETLSSWDDYELGLRILLMHPSMRKLPGKLVATYFTEESLTGTRFSDSAEATERALDRCAEDLDKAGLASDWIDVRRAMLAAEYAREGVQTEAKRLLSKTLAGKPLPKRALLRALYLKHRVAARGTTLLAALFLGNEPKTKAKPSDK